MKRTKTEQRLLKVIKEAFVKALHIYEFKTVKKGKVSRSPSSLQNLSKGRKGTSRKH